MINMYIQITVKSFTQYFTMQKNDMDVQNSFHSQLNETDNWKYRVIYSGTWTENKSILQLTCDCLFKAFANACKLLLKNIFLFLLIYLYLNPTFLKKTPHYQNHMQPVPHRTKC
jgi:hypothetical protein